MPTNSLEDKILVIISSVFEKKIIRHTPIIGKIVKKEGWKVFSLKRKKDKARINKPIVGKNFLYLIFIAYPLPNLFSQITNNDPAKSSHIREWIK